MSKHSLISTGLGLGLMAISMGASAQLHSFDGGMMFYGSASGGSKYVAFVPQLTRSATTLQGAAGVLMLELFQPATGTASGWSYAIGGAVDFVAGGPGYSSTVAPSLLVASDSTAFVAVSTLSWTAGNGLTNVGNFYFGDADAIALSFSNQVVVSSQACNVTFSAAVGTNDQLLFNNVAVRASDINSATAEVSLTTGAGAVVSIAQSVWNNAAATLPTYAAHSSFAIGGLTAASASNAVTSSIAGIYNAQANAHNKCVPAYTARALGTGTTFTNTAVGMIRIW